MKHPNNTHTPWHGLPLYFSDRDPEKAMVGLAVMAVLAENPMPTQQEMWQMYFKLRGAQAEGPKTDFLAQNKWLEAAASTAEALPGGAFLAASLKKLAQPEKIPAGVLAAYHPTLARQDKGKDKIALSLAAQAIQTWQHVGQQGVKKTSNTPLEELISHLLWLEPHDRPHLPKAVLKELKELHLALVLSQDSPELGQQNGLSETVEHMLPLLQPFQSPRFNGFGEKAKRASFNQPHGYGDVPKGIFKTLMAENVWLHSLPVYWQGAVLTDDEQQLLAQTRRESSLKESLETALTLNAYKTTPSQSGFKSKGLTRKAILDGIIHDTTQRKEQ